METIKVNHNNAVAASTALSNCPSYFTSGGLSSVDGKSTITANQSIKDAFATSRAAQNSYSSIIAGAGNEVMVVDAAFREADRIRAARIDSGGARN